MRLVQAALEEHLAEAAEDFLTFPAVYLAAAADLLAG